MFEIFKNWFEKRKDPEKDTIRPALTFGDAATRGIRAEVPVFRGPKSISEEVISRVAKEIELEGLGAPDSASRKDVTDKGLSRS